MNKIKIYYLNIEDIKNNEEYIVSFISKERLEKAKKYIVKNDYLLSIGGSYLLYKYTNEKNVHYEINGKPYVNNINFSISHSHEMVAIALNSKPIGLDIEYIRELSIDITNTIATAEEKDHIHSNEDLFKLWCLKESLGKCIGIGLKKGIKNLTPKEGLYRYNNRTYVSKAGTFNGYQLALTIKDDIEIELEMSHDTINVSNY